MEHQRRPMMGVVETVYHTPPDEQPFAVESRFSRQLETDEQPWPKRRLTVAEEWQPLDRGWLEQASMLHLSNEEGRFTQVQPTPEEREAADAKVVELAVACLYNGSETRTAFGIVRPGESTRFEPFALQNLHVRCRSGFAKCVLTLFPK